MNETSDIFLSAPSAWLRAAEKVLAQHWPASALYVVATPIGNLGDLSVRAWQALAKVDVVAAEDTRVTRTLFDAWGLSTPLMAAHRHNEASAAQDILERLAAGQRVALVSDAGAPAVSDPGARVVRAVREAGYQVVPVPGPSAVIAALMASGATSDENPAFAFAGFAPHKSMARQRWLRRWAALAAPVVFFESPHRLKATLADVLEIGGPQRRITIARELSKRFEEVATVPAAGAQAWLEAQPHRGQGEFVLILHESEAQISDEDEDAADAGDPALDTLLDALLESLSLRDAVKVAQKVTGGDRDAIYRRALQRKNEAD
ncbi:16S rRNA (cytidine(1402)-2'-O)-methyltransferase [Kerstersia sp.]|uniref:16S rRNA (cytidine(1402)-2'-O)-methyltransferase n=1 Tax=Kerstersia sp. TaxID=1930783 RepID=UPI003F90B8DB